MEGWLSGRCGSDSKVEIFSNATKEPMDTGEMRKIRPLGKAPKQGKLAIAKGDFWWSRHENASSFMASQWRFSNTSTLYNFNFYF